MNDIATLPFNGLGVPEYALLVDRMALGTFFTISGYHKLFNQERHASLVSTMIRNKIPLPQVNQWFVPGVEFFGGLSLLVGLIAPLAALGLLIICLVASCTDGRSRIAAWKPIDRADYVDDVLYLPEVLLALMLLPIIIGGSGYSIDTWIIDLIQN